MPKRKTVKKTAANKKATSKTPNKPRLTKAGKPYIAAKDKPVTPRKRKGPRCSAMKANGQQCKGAPIKGGTTCHKHGGSAPQVRKAANQRLIEMVLPAMGELHRIINKKDATDADKLRAVSMVLNRTGYHERQEIDLGLRQPTPWDELEVDSIRIAREHIEWDDDDTDAVEPGASRPELQSGDDFEQEQINWHAVRKVNRHAEEREGYLDNDNHEVVTGRVVGGGDGDGPITFLGEEQTRSRREAQRPSEHDPQPSPRPNQRNLTDPPEYVRDALAEDRRQRRRRR